MSSWGSATKKQNAKLPSSPEHLRRCKLTKPAPSKAEVVNSRPPSAVRRPRKPQKHGDVAKEYPPQQHRLRNAGKTY